LSLISDNTSLALLTLENSQLSLSAIVEPFEGRVY